MLRAGSDSWIKGLADARVLKAKIDGIEVQVPAAGMAAPILSRIDGRRSIAEIQRDLLHSGAARAGLRSAAPSTASMPCSTSSIACS